MVLQNRMHGGIHMHQESAIDKHLELKAAVCYDQDVQTEIYHHHKHVKTLMLVLGPSSTSPFWPPYGSHASTLVLKAFVIKLETRDKALLVNAARLETM
ncbi:hypothetical protein H5410_029590 [Solanum commersonii]|uniref:Uncharacterized protein n=1 Tax=Solanum commersonii TaxID=4109 RepID=A0A9J5YG50_SOLCO|nr:hypothetical protein H5410_029590 [Solanum commersonii]